MNPRLLEAAKRAMSKAVRSTFEEDVLWDHDKQAWRVLSATGSGEFYFLRIDARSKRGDPWWVRLVCTCPAADSGLDVCWHKAAVALRWRRGKMPKVEEARVYGE